MADQDDGRILIFAFNNQSPDYAYGFESGKVYGQMESGVKRIEGMFHQCNLVDLRQMAENKGYRIEKLNAVPEGHWVDLLFVKVPTPLLVLLKQWATDLVNRFKKNV